MRTNIFKRNKLGAKTLALSLCSLWVGGCIPFAHKQHHIYTEKPLEIRSQYHALDDIEESAQTNERNNTPWWDVYNNDQLNTLITQAFIHNPDINQIRARIAQATAQKTITSASLLPSFTLNGERSATRSKPDTASQYNLGGAASFELDLWDKNAAARQSSIHDIYVQEENLRNAQITLSGMIVESWLDYLAFTEQEQLLQEQIETNKTILNLQKRRFEMGTTGILDILQQKEIVAQSQAQLPDIIAGQKQAINNLTLLVASPNDTTLDKINGTTLPLLPPLPHTGLPANLLANRPDLVAAWNQLRASEWDIKVAWADRLPDFNITANASTTAPALNGILDTWVLTIIAQTAAPIFDGGARKAEQKRREALANEQYHLYRDVVLTAVNDVENALVTNIFQDKKLTALKKQLTAARKTRDQAHINYVNGEQSYINVLNSLNSVQSLERQITTERLARAKARVALYRALGGQSWTNDDLKPKNKPEK